MNLDADNVALLIVFVRVFHVDITVGRKLTRNLLPVFASRRNSPGQKATPVASTGQVSGRSL